MPLRHTDTNNVAVKLFSFHNKDKTLLFLKEFKNAKSYGTGIPVLCKEFLFFKPLCCPDKNMSFSFVQLPPPPSVLFNTPTPLSALCLMFLCAYIGGGGAAAAEGFPLLLVEPAVRARQGAHLPLPGLPHPRLLPGIDMGHVMFGSLRTGYTSGCG